MSTRDSTPDESCKPLEVESRSARREFTQCQNCYKDKESTKIKLSLCTGCRIATYCSSTCQREHWPRHRSICMMRRETIQRLANLDNVARSSGSTPALTPTELMTELRSFTQKFNPLLFQTAYNCLHIRDTPKAWENYVAYVMLKRLPHVPRSSRPWQRYMVEWVSPLPVQHVVEQMDNGSSRFVETKTAQEQHHRQAGHLGTLTMIISGACNAVEPPLIIHNVTYFGFGSHSESALEVTDRWQELFMETVERMCGRAPADRSPEP